MFLIFINYFFDYKQSKGKIGIKQNFTFRFIVLATFLNPACRSKA